MTVSGLKPSKQGQLDGACGFYAIVNAIKRLDPELPEQKLFGYSLKGFLQTGDAMAFADGMTRKSLKNTLRRTIKALHDDYILYDYRTEQEYQFDFSMPWWRHDAPRSRKLLLEQLSQAGARQGCVCIVGYSYADTKDEEGCEYHHWSVVTQVKDDKLHMFDSDGEKRKIPLEELRIQMKPKSKLTYHKTRPYIFKPSELFVLFKQPV